MDTSNLFITRKRKKWKFAHFDSWPNCFAADEVGPYQWRQPLTVELGAGTADLSVGMAQLHAGRQYVAVDIKSDRLYTGAKFALEHNLPNIAFVRSRVNEVDKLFAPGSVDELWITFPDPFPRKRQAKHRLTHPHFLSAYSRLLASDGTLCFKTDNHDLFLWSLEQLVAQKWHLKELSFDLHESDLPAQYKITTYYERRFIAMGLPIHFVSAKLPIRPHGVVGKKQKL